MKRNCRDFIFICTVFLFLLGFSIWGIVKPDVEFSVSERRLLAEFPEINIGTIKSGRFMSEWETYVLEQFPLRQQFRTLKALTVLNVLRQKDNNGNYIQDGYLSKLEYSFNEKSVEYAAGRFRFIFDKYLAGKASNVYLSVIPDKNYFMARQNGYPSIDYNMLISSIEGEMDYAKYIDITGLLELSDYYRTDTHWKQEEIRDVAEKLASEMGVTLTNSYTKRKLDNPFYGVYFGQNVLPIKADSIYYMDNELFDHCIIYDYETETYIPMYDMEKGHGADSYELFLSGSKALLTIENPKAASALELIIFRDSFGSSLIPYLVEAYEKITIVDIRYISPHMLGQLINFDGQDILFLYSTSILNNSITLK